MSLMYLHPLLLLNLVQNHVTHLIHQHNYDRQFCKHLKGQGPSWYDCVLQLEAERNIELTDTMVPDWYKPNDVKGYLHNQQQKQFQEGLCLRKKGN